MVPQGMILKLRRESLSRQLWTSTRNSSLFHMTWSLGCVSSTTATSVAAISGNWTVSKHIICTQHGTRIWKLFMVSPGRCCDRVPRDRVPRRPSAKRLSAKRLSAKETECQGDRVPSGTECQGDRVPSGTECQERLSAKWDWVPRETECQERLSAKKEKLSIKSDYWIKFLTQNYLYWYQKENIGHKNFSLRFLDPK